MVVAVVVDVVVVVVDGAGVEATGGVMVVVNVDALGFVCDEGELGAGT